MITVEEIIDDPDFAQDFTIVRSRGSFVRGKWTESEPELINVTGTITMASARDLRMVPEGDRITGAMTFHTKEAMYPTRSEGSNSGISDMISWRGDIYKIVGMFPYMDFGYSRAIGERVKGS